MPKPSAASTGPMPILKDMFAPPPVGVVVVVTVEASGFVWVAVVTPVSEFVTVFVTVVWFCVLSTLASWGVVTLVDVEPVGLASWKLPDAPPLPFFDEALSVLFWYLYDRETGALKLTLVAPA